MQGRDIPKIGDLELGWNKLTDKEKAITFEAAANRFSQLRYFTVESIANLMHREHILQMIWQYRKERVERDVASHVEQVAN